jgi:hypothetical protein
MTTIEEIQNVDINAWRNGYKWTINECLKLEREFGLLKLSIPEIAILHKRTINAIMFKLEAEGLDTYNNLYFKTFGSIDEQIDKLNNLCSTTDNDEDEDYVPNLDDDDEEDDDDDEESYENNEEDYEDVEHDHIENITTSSNQTYVFDQIKKIHKHINNLLGYFSTSKTQTQTQEEVANY